MASLVGQRTFPGAFSGTFSSPTTLLSARLCTLPSPMCLLIQSAAESFRCLSHGFLRQYLLASVAKEQAARNDRYRIALRADLVTGLYFARLTYSAIRTVAVAHARIRLVHHR